MVSQPLVEAPDTMQFPVSQEPDEMQFPGALGPDQEDVISEEEAKVGSLNQSQI